MLALILKDLKFIFSKLEIYLCFGIVLLLAGFFFFSNLDSYNQLVALQSNLPSKDLENLSLETQVLNYYWFSLNIIGIFSSTFLAIKIYDQEKQFGMFDKLIRVIGIKDFLLSKLIVILIINLLQIMIFIFLPVVLSFTNIIWFPQIITAAFGTFLSLTVYSSLAILMASLSSGIWLVSLASISLIFTSYFLYSIALKLPSEYAEIFKFLSILTHQQRFISGLVSLQSIVILLSTCAFMFVLSIQINKKNQV